jgi:serine/threonine-protein kinase
MSEPSQPGTRRSLLAEQLNVTPPPPGPESLRGEERARLAEAKVGLTIKGWRLTRLLGVGPVTAAYEVTRGSRDGAAKGVLRLMIGSIGRNERARSQFLRAAYAANRFTHPRVLPVTADGTDDEGAPFVVRPWVDGEPLADLVAREGPMKEDAVLRIAEQILDALEIAHAHGVVHGAISPENVIVTPRGSMRLADFATPPGIGPNAGDDVLASRRATPWAAPERCSSSPDAPTEASDTWSIAACMYFALTRARPRGDKASIADLARTPPRPVRELAPLLGEGLASVLDHALTPDPARRYESAYAMLGDIRRVLAGRRPKLGDASKPNPSGSYSGAMPRTSRSGLTAGRTETSIVQPMAVLAATRAETTAARKANEWKGNVALILAIAALVGVATFVMVRERVEDERSHQSAPAHPG